ncbi:boron transporter 4 [Tanacetum coccineum]
MNIDNDTTELSFVQQRLHGVSATSQCYSPFNNRKHTRDNANVSLQSAVLSLASTATTNYPMIQHLLPQILILGLHVQPQELDPMPVEVTTVAKQEPDTGDRRHTKRLLNIDNQVKTDPGNNGVEDRYSVQIKLKNQATLLSGLLGLPPSNGVLPQSPMHTKSLVILKKQDQIWASELSVYLTNSNVSLRFFCNLEA